MADRNPSDELHAVAPVVSIGVTGHRALGDVARMRALIDAAVDSIVADTRVRLGAEPALRAVSAIAEGADRLVVEQVLRHPGSTLEVVLPLDQDAYADDFETAQSRRVFAELLERAAVVVRAPAVATRDRAYEAAGRAVVDRSDVVLALWDGQPARGRGGTAQIVAYALARGVRVLWVQTEPPYEIVEIVELPAGRPHAT